MAPSSAAPRQQDLVLESLLNAPVDDEPETAEERAALDEARARLDAGELGIPLELLAKKWGIRLPIDPSPTIPVHEGSVVTVRETCCVVDWFDGDTMWEWVMR
jgi:hypothetical protein